VENPGDGGGRGGAALRWLAAAAGWGLALLTLLAVARLWASLSAPVSVPPPLTVPFTVFKEQVRAGNVATVSGRGDQLQGTFKSFVTYPPSGLAGSRTSTAFQTQLPVFADEGLEALLEQQGVVVSAVHERSDTPLWLTLAASVGPAILIAGVVLGLSWLNARGQRTATATTGGPFGFARSGARRYDGAAHPPTRVTFADVAGIDEAEGDLQELVDFLMHPRKYQRLGGAIPRGVLLVGPPGTGKTLLAKAVAGEAGVPFFSLSGSEFVEVVVGVGAARVRDLFARAKKEAPAIVFVDELDAVGRRRDGIGAGAANEEQEQTLNQLLTEMDGFDSPAAGSGQAVIVLAATNRPDVLDPALLRPGRFDRRVVVQAPDRPGRAAILRVHTRRVPLAADVDLGALAASTPGLAGADLRNLVNEAALAAARSGRDAVTARDLQDALERVTLGAARHVLLSPDDRRRIAVHESGHALLGLLLPEADPVQKVTIVPRGQALGLTYQVPLDDRVNYSEPYLRARIAGALGGRAAEALIFGSVSTGAENDLQQATGIARQMVTRWGMSPKVGLRYAAPGGPGYLADEQAPPPLDRATGGRLADLIDEETKRLLDEGLAVAQSTLTRERPRLQALTAALLEWESLDAAGVRRIAGLPPTAAPDRIAHDRRDQPVQPIGPARAAPLPAPA
jgi:cell division protease FtsH